MPCVARLTLTTLTVCLLLGGLFYARPAFLARLNLDIGALPECCARLERERGRSDDLDEEEVALQRRMQEKGKVGSELVAGRLTLLQAAARFRDLSAGVRHFWNHLRWTYPEASEEERLCRYVIGWAEANLTLAPSRLYALTQRLRAELAEVLRAGSRFTLPRRG